MIIINEVSRPVYRGNNIGHPLICVPFLPGEPTELPPKHFFHRF